MVTQLNIIHRQDLQVDVSSDPKSLAKIAVDTRARKPLAAAQKHRSVILYIHRFIFDSIKEPKVLRYVLDVGGGWGT